MFTREPLRWLPAWVLAGAVLVSAQQKPAPTPDSPPAQAKLPASAAAVEPFLGAHPQAQVAFVPKPLPSATPEQIGDSLQARRRYQAALDSYKKVQPPSAAVWNKMGIAYQMMFNLKEAMRCYRAAIKLDHRNANFYNNLGTVYDSQKNYRQAERMYRKALKIDAQSATVLKNLGTNLLMQHKYAKGWDAYTQALTLDPEIFMDHDSPRVENPSTVKERGAMNYYMARGCVRMGQTECALQYLRMALNEGFITPQKLAEDEDFYILRNDPGFQQLLAAQQQPKPPRNR
ncbi:MAG: tetratricopeptide repeat protein [Acidobacteriota bacterium]